MRGHEHVVSTHLRRAGTAILWTGGLMILYVMVAFPLAFGFLSISQIVAMIFVSPVLPAVWLMRAGLHPIAAVVLTFLAYCVAGFGVIEWRAQRTHAVTDVRVLAR